MSQESCKVHRGSAGRQNKAATSNHASEPGNVSGRVMSGFSAPLASVWDVPSSTVVWQDMVNAVLGQTRGAR